MLSAAGILQRLKAHEVTHVVGLPDNLCRKLLQLIEEDESMEIILVSREGEAFALASGLYAGGKKPLVLIQNTGFLESGDAFRGTTWNMTIPQVILMGYRGYKTLDPDQERKDSVAELTEPTLDAWNIPYDTLRSDADLDKIDTAFKEATASSRPRAVLLAATTA